MRTRDNQEKNFEQINSAGQRVRIRENKIKINYKRRETSRLLSHLEL